MRVPRPEFLRIPREYAIAACAVVIATLGMLAFRAHLGVLNVLLIYLLVVFALALTMGAGPAAAMALLSFLLFDFLFIPPYYTLTIADSDHVLTVFVYLGVAIITAQLVARVRARTEVAIREQRRTALLYELNAALIGDVTIDQILTTIVERVVHVYGAAACRILLPTLPDNHLVVRAGYPQELNVPPDRQMQSVAGRALATRTPLGLSQQGRRVIVPAGMRTEALRHKGALGDVLFVPIVTADRAVGVLEVHGRPGSGRLDADAEQVLTSFANQAALALERARLTGVAAEAAALAQSDELKSALLAAVSHDLRTPLAVIKAAATSLLDSAVEWSDDERKEFACAINEETDRLSLMVSNLLDLSRIEGGVLKPDREWYDGAELIEDVADRLESRSAATNHAITLDIAPSLPLLYLDYVEIAQVLMNLGENAIKYSPAGTSIVIGAKPCSDAVEFFVRDQGPGIPEHERDQVFSKFYRLRSHSNLPGSGIGLSISKGLVEAHGGRIWVEGKPGTGTTFRFTIPSTTPTGAAA